MRRRTSPHHSKNLNSDPILDQDRNHWPTPLGGIINNNIYFEKERERALISDHILLLRYSPFLKLDFIV